MTDSNPTKEFYDLFIIIYDHFNLALFAGELNRPLITVTRQNNVFGYYSFNRWKKSNEQSADEIAINPVMFKKYPLIEICQTIVHEMCHQWQTHFGKTSRQGYHNLEWGEKMITIGLMPSHNGKPGGKKTGQKMADYLIEGGSFELSTKGLFEKEVFNALYYDMHTSNVVVLSENFTTQEESITTSQNSNNTSPVAYVESVLTAKEKKQKIKYSCDICEINLWGKPGLHIICGSCKSKFEEVTPNKNFNY